MSCSRRVGPARSRRAASASRRSFLSLDRWEDFMRSGKLYRADTLLKPPVRPVARTPQFLSLPMNMARLSVRLAACAGLLIWVFVPASGGSQVAASAPTFAMVIHGGAGTILRQNMTPEME